MTGPVQAEQRTKRGRARMVLTEKQTERQGTERNGIGRKTNTADG